MIETRLKLLTLSVYLCDTLRDVPLLLPLVLPLVLP